MYSFLQILKMDLKNLFFKPMWLFYTAAFPLLLVAVLGFLTSGSYGEVLTSYDYYGITIMIFSGMNTATLAANSFLEKHIKGANMRLIFAPVSGFSIYFSKILATTIYATVYYTLVGILLSFAGGVNYGGASWYYSWFLLVILNFFSASLSVMLCCIFKSEEATNQMVSNIVSLCALLGGLFFPVAGFGKAIEYVSRISPAKWIASAAFQSIYDQNHSLFFPVLLVLFLFSILWILLSSKLFNREDYL